MGKLLWTTSNLADDLWYNDVILGTEESDSPNNPLFYFDFYAIFDVQKDFTWTRLQKRRSNGEIVYRPSVVNPSFFNVTPTVGIGEINKIDVNNIIPENLKQGIVDAFNASLTYHHYKATDMFMYISDFTNYGADIAITRPLYLEYVDNTSENKKCNVSDTVSWNINEDYRVSYTLNLALALYSVNSDIENGFIEVPNEIRDFLKNTIKSGLNSNTAVNWNVNIDGVKNPNITLTWDAPRAEEIDQCSILLHVGNSKDPREPRFYLGRFDYASGQPQTWNFNSLYEKGSDSAELNAKINEFLMNLISDIKAYTYIFMQMDYIENGTLTSSTLCFCEIHFDGKASGGIMPNVISDGSKVNITYENTDDIYKDFDSEDESDNIDIINYGVSALSLLTKSYVMTTSRLKQLGNFLWSDDFMTKILNVNSNPIENIISCKVFPFTINGGSDKEIVLGNVACGILGNPIEENTNFIIDVGSFSIPKYYNNWLDFERTTIGIFLPMCGGFHNLNVNSYMGKTLSVKYYIDILTGVCKAVLYVNNIPCEEFSGQIGFDIPLTASNRSQVELAQITSITSAITSAASGNISGISNIGEAIFPPKTNYATVGSISPTVNMMTTHDVFLIIERPKIQYPSNYNHVYGKPCNLTITLNNLHGYTQCENVDLSNISCTDNERDMIRNILENGFYVD